MTSRGCAKRLLCTRPMKCRSMASVTSKSVITPWRSGRTAEIEAGVRPIIRWASCADSVHLLSAGVDRHHRRLRHADALAAHVDERVGGAEVDRHVAAADAHAPPAAHHAVMGDGPAAHARRKASTASTRRWSSGAGGRPSLPKMLVTCFSTARSVTTMLLRDRVVRAALGHQLEHLALARRELLERVVAARAAHELGHHLGVERRAAVGHAPDGVDEALHVGHAVLQQVADAAGASRRPGRARSPPPRTGRARARPCRAARPDLERGPQAVVCVRGGHADVDHRNVRLVGPHLTDQVLGVARLAHDLEAVLLEQPHHALAQEHRVVGDTTTRMGSAPCTCVPRPAPSRSRAGPRARAMPVGEPAQARCRAPGPRRRPRRPPPRRPGARSRARPRRSRGVAFAYLATLVSASATTK